VESAGLASALITGDEIIVDTREALELRRTSRSKAAIAVTPD
jgi:hypothetical protein